MNAITEAWSKATNAQELIKPNTQSHIKRLNEKALIACLKMGAPSFSRRDKAAEQHVQDQFADESLTVRSRIFKNPSNPVYKFMSQWRAVYTYHVNSTYPSNETGQRILAVHALEEYRRVLGDMIEEVNRAKTKLLPMYDNAVQMDIQDRTQKSQSLGKQSDVSITDYPTASQFEQSVYMQLRLLPMPDRAHFLFDVSQDDINALDDYIREVESTIRVEIVKRLLDPVGKLVAKISIPLEDQSRFHASTVTNVIDAVEAFKKFNVDKDPQLTQMVEELDREVKRYSIDYLKESPTARASARTNLDAIASKMAAFM
jgi:hypothetical protein